MEGSAASEPRSPNRSGRSRALQTQFTESVRTELDPQTQLSEARRVRYDQIMKSFAALIVCFCCVGNAAETITLPVGHAQRLTAESGHFTCSDPKVAEVLDNGYVIALAPGTAQVRAGKEEWTLTATAAKVETRDLSSIKQYADDRKFTVDGVLCYGCELNSRAVVGEDRATASHNRILNPQPVSPDKPVAWEAQPNTPVVDGAGARIGTVAATTSAGDKRVPTSAFNYGMSKIIDGKLYLYAFGVDVRPSPTLANIAEVDRKGVVGVSAWLPFDSVIDNATLAERVGIGRAVHPRMPLEEKRYRITGGKPKAYELPGSKELRIVSDPDSPAVPSHYLRRPAGTVNILYSVPGFGLGGQGVDSVLVTSNATFRLAKGVRKFVQPTYFPAGHPREGKKSDKTMTFVYGVAEVNGSEIAWGWIAQEALEP
jgi:hypothetical protein